MDYGRMVVEEPRQVEQAAKVERGSCWHCQTCCELRVSTLPCPPSPGHLCKDLQAEDASQARQLPTELPLHCRASLERLAP